MRHLLKFLLGVLVVALTLMSATTLEAQKMTITSKTTLNDVQALPYLEINVAVKVAKHIGGNYSLKAVVVADGNLRLEDYDVKWFRGGDLISTDWKLENVKKGKYRVVIHSIDSNSWGEARVNLFEPSRDSHLTIDDM